jgi:8-oxo-dGTP pyrophosphatase MutT (NUDIX family)
MYGEKMTEEVERSAGGVLVQVAPDGGGLLVCLIQTPTRGGNPSWRLPKGWIEEDETPEQAALRETQEETGCRGELLSKLSEIEYWYTRRGEGSGERVRVQKLVQFFLLLYIDGSIEDHDHEVEEVKWYTFAEASKIISYDAEKKVLQEAMHSWDAYLYRRGMLY